MGGAALANAGWWPFFTGAPADFDEHLTALISDLHINGAGTGPTYQRERLQKVVAQILALDPLPRRCIVFGDIAYGNGCAADYRLAKELLKPLADAHIALVLGLGNHDHRAPFAEIWPEVPAASPVPTCAVTPVTTPDCDLIMLDSLAEDAKNPTAPNRVPGAFPEAEQEWMAAMLPTWPRPFFLCAHHPFSEHAGGGRFSQLKVCGAALDTFFAKMPRAVGYVNGHEHRWQHKVVIADWGKRRLVQNAILPSTGHWGDIGYTLMRTEPGKATLSLFQDDFYFNEPMPPERTPPDWSAMVAANRGATCRFAWPSEKGQSLLI